ncbi:hypothetical protein NPIL_305101, partial [Nephila pilipes]
QQPFVAACGMWPWRLTIAGQLPIAHCGGMPSQQPLSLGQQPPSQRALCMPWQPGSQPAVAGRKTSAGFRLKWC